MADYETDAVFTSDDISFLMSQRPTSIALFISFTPTFIFPITEYSMLSELHVYISLSFAVRTSLRVPQGVLTAVYTTAARRETTQFLLSVRKKKKQHLTL